jgi:hypothetical protein
MITDEDFPVEPWQVREVRLDLKLLAQSESLFALSNGHIGLRGNFDEGEPHGLPGTYLNSFYEVRPLPYAEAGFGYPEAGQTVVDVTNGKVLRLMVNDELFDVRYGQLIDHERILDLRAGTLERRVHWCSPAGRQVKLVSTRLVSLAQRSVAAIEYVVEAVDEFVRITVQSELVSNEDQPETSKDPRVSAVLDRPLEAVDHETTENRAVLMHRTRASGLMMSAAMDHEIEVPGRVEVETEVRPDLARTTVICGLRPGQKLRIVKYLAYGWSSLRSRPALRDQAAGALAGAKYSGWDGLGTPRMSRSTAIRSSSRRCDSACSTCCSQAHVLNDAELPAKASPVPVTTATSSGTARDTSCPSSPTPRRTRPPMHCVGAHRHWIWPRSVPVNSVSKVRHFRGGQFAARNAPATGRRARRRSTSTPTSRWRSSATASSPATSRWRRNADSKCSSKPRGFGVRSATTTATASGTSTG